jgi:CAAX protease family protein
MSTTTIAGPAVDQRRQPVTQYSRAEILGLWAAATGPMAILAWVVAPWLSHYLGGPEPLGQALLIVLNVGLVWILALTLVVIKREQGSLKWSGVRDALWLRSPQDPKTRCVGGKVWWWVVPFLVLSTAFALVPTVSGPLPRDFPNFITTDRAEHFYNGAWGMFALTVLVAFLSPVVEELFFRGLLLPRMCTAFGRGDWLANGAAFALYHLHQPWSMPGSLLDGTFAQAYPAKRFRSIWISIATHTAPSFLMIGVVLALVLK